MKRTPSKHRKRTADSVDPPQPRTKATAEAVNAAALETMATSIDTIRETIDDIRSGKVVLSRRDPASVIASLAAKAATLYEATRKAEAARAKQLSKLNPALVLNWYRSLDQSDREQLRSELENVDERKNGLG